MLRRVDDAHTRRLGFLDAIRGLAVLWVLFQHFGEYVSGWVRDVSLKHLQFGQLGVALFFCVSGFIIPVSLHRTGKLSTFWVHRFFRLYPAYWLSLLGAAVAIGYGLKHSPLHGAGDWLADTTMLQNFVHRPDAWGPYWTLAWELAFYALMSTLFVLGLHRRSVPILLGAVGVVLLVQLSSWNTGPDFLPADMFTVAIMLCGYAIYQWRFEQLSGAVLAFVLLVWAAAAVVIRRDDGTSDATLASWLLAVAAFLLFVEIGRRWQFPAWLQRVGRISFSIYLVHPMVLIFFRFAGLPAAARVVIWLVATLAISELSHRYIERPAIRVGRRVSALSRS